MVRVAYLIPAIIAGFAQLNLFALLCFLLGAGERGIADVRALSEPVLADDEVPVLKMLTEASTEDAAAPMITERDKLPGWKMCRLSLTGCGRL